MYVESGGCSFDVGYFRRVQLDFQVANLSSGFMDMPGIQSARFQCILVLFHLMGGGKTLIFVR